MSSTTETSPRARVQNSRAWSWRVWIALNATVFSASACIMTVEILSTRLVARYLGSSIYTWTSAIGVVLAGISLGNYIGGRLADRYEPRKTLALLFVTSSVACMTIPILNGWLGRATVLEGFSWPTRTLLHFTFTFLAPATVLGTMSPVVAKMALNLGVAAGRTIGTIYAWGSVGSIFGTFAAGFWLVASVGTERSILVVSAVLALVGVLYGHRVWLPKLWAGGLGLALAGLLIPSSLTTPLEASLGLRDPEAERIVFSQDSHYQRVSVLDVGDNRRRMLLDSLTHSRVDLTDPLALEYEYEAVYAEVMQATRPGDQPVSAYFIGGGGFVFPRYVEIVRPGSFIEVSEIDPVVREAAFEACGIPETTTIRFRDMDARNHVTDLLRDRREGREVPKFDFIFGDAFNDFSVPSHLVTLEFDEQLAELLADDGVYLLNLIDIFQSGKFLGAVISTLREVFPHVYLFEPDTGSRTERNTFVVVSSRKPLDLSKVSDRALATQGVRCKQISDAGVAHLVRGVDGLVLTDDFCPAENLLASVVRKQTRGGGVAYDDFVDEIAALFEQGAYDQVISRCQAMLAARSRTPRLHHMIGVTKVRQGQLEPAVEEFRAEIEVNPSYAKTHASLASTLLLLDRPDEALTHFEQAVALQPTDVQTRLLFVDVLVALDREDEAEAMLRETIEARPGHIGARLKLGNRLYASGRSKDALEMFDVVLKLDPDYPGAHHDYGLALLHSGQAAEAAVQFQAAAKLDPENAVLQNQIGRALGVAGEHDRALDHFQQAVRLAPDNASYHANLGLASEQLGRWQAARDAYRACLERSSQNLPVMNALARLLADGADAAVRDGDEALRLAEEVNELTGNELPDVLETVAMAQAETGRFQEATETAGRALRIAELQGQNALISSLGRRLQLYQAGRAR